MADTEREKQTRTLKLYFAHNGTEREKGTHMAEGERDGTHTRTMARERERETAGTHTHTIARERETAHTHTHAQ